MLQTTYYKIAPYGFFGYLPSFTAIILTNLHKNPIRAEVGNE